MVLYWIKCRREHQQNGTACRRANTHFTRAKEKTFWRSSFIDFLAYIITYYSYYFAVSYLFRLSFLLCVDVSFFSARPSLARCAAVCWPPIRFTNTFLCAIVFDELKWWSVLFAGALRHSFVFSCVFFFFRWRCLIKILSMSNEEAKYFLLTRCDWRLYQCLHKTKTERRKKIWTQTIESKNKVFNLNEQRGRRSRERGRGEEKR